MQLSVRFASEPKIFILALLRNKELYSLSSNTEKSTSWGLISIITTAISALREMTDI